MASEQLTADIHSGVLDGGYGPSYHEDNDCPVAQTEGGFPDAWTPTNEVADYTPNAAALTLRALTNHQYESMDAMGG